MEINIPTGQDVLRDTAVQYANKAFVYITDCNPPLMTCLWDKNVSQTDGGFWQLLTPPLSGCH